MSIRSRRRRRGKIKAQWRTKVAKRIIWLRNYTFAYQIYGKVEVNYVTWPHPNRPDVFLHSIVERFR